jgi:hypothetical protein
MHLQNEVKCALKVVGFFCSRGMEKRYKIAYTQDKNLICLRYTHRHAFNMISSLPLSLEWTDIYTLCKFKKKVKGFLQGNYIEST